MTEKVCWAVENLVTTGNIGKMTCWGSKRPGEDDQHPMEGSLWWETLYRCAGVYRAAGDGHV